MDLNIFKYTPFRQNTDSEGQVLTPDDDLSDISSRLLNEDGSFNVVRKGHSVKNMYQDLLTASWPKFLISVVSFFIISNSIFAMLFTLNGVENIGRVSQGFGRDYLESFYFSVQTFTTLGYGNLSPQNDIANIVASLDAFTGMITVALLTGLFFARFSKPRAYISFSKHILVAPNREGKRSLQFRIVHDHRHKIIDLEARVTMTWLQKDGGRIRRMFAKLPLEIDRIFLMPLNWTIVHLIDEESPLYGFSIEDIHARNIEILIVIKGFDETYSTTVHADRSYQCSDFVENSKFTPMYHIRKNDTILDLNLLDNYEPHDFGTEVS